MVRVWSRQGPGPGDAAKVAAPPPLAVPAHGCQPPPQELCQLQRLAQLSPRRTTSSKSELCWLHHCRLLSVYGPHVSGMMLRLAVGTVLKAEGMLFTNWGGHRPLSVPGLPPWGTVRTPAATPAAARQARRPVPAFGSTWQPRSAELPTRLSIAGGGAPDTAVAWLRPVWEARPTQGVLQEASLWSQH